MGNGTIQAKLEPLSRIEKVQNIFFLRKTTGPSIPKVRYLTLPSVCRFSFFNIILTPLLLTYYVIRLKCSFIISYHIIPYAFFAAFASSISRKPYFVCQTGLRIQAQANNKLFWLFLKPVLIKARKICVPGSKSELFWQSKKIPESQIIRLHSTVDTAKYTFPKKNNPTYDFLYVGRFAPEKRLPLLLKAFSTLINRFPESSMLMVGNGPLLEEIKRLSKEYKIDQKIEFSGYQQDVLPYLKKARHIVLTSATEGLPCAIMEAMSTGLVPITTKVGNLPDIVIDGKTGFLSTKDDPDTFASNMISALTLTYVEYYKMQNNARKTILNYHSHKFSKELWEALLTNK